MKKKIALYIRTSTSRQVLGAESQLRELLKYCRLNEVENYEIFQDGISIGFTGNTTSYAINGLIANSTYEFTIVALDATNNRSDQSDEVLINTQEDTVEVNYTSLNSNLETIDWKVKDLYANQNVGIGTLDTQGYRLAVAGNIVAEEIKEGMQVLHLKFGNGTVLSVDERLVATIKFDQIADNPEKRIMLQFAKLQILG